MPANSEPEVIPDFATYVEVTASLLQLPIPDQLQAGVVDQFTQIWRVAQLVLAFSLADDIDPAPTFEP